MILGTLTLRGISLRTVNTIDNIWGLSMRGAHKRRRPPSMRNAKLINRVQSPNPLQSHCRVIGCQHLASASSGNGLNLRFCRKHEDFYECHGSYYKSSYSADQINPYVQSARKWLGQNETNPVVHRAILNVKRLYSDAGQPIEAFRLNGLSPRDRAKAAWARLRVASVDPIKPLAAWIAIELITIKDPQSERKQHYKRVQAAKLIHRMASGTHKTWHRTNGDGEIRVVTLRKYPRSRGKVLVHIGEQIEAACELIVSHHLNEILIK